MTDFDFEQLMKKALENNDEPSELLNATLKNKIKEYKPKNANFYYLKTTAVAACMVIAVTSIILNSSPAIQSKINTLPVISHLANALTFKNHETTNPVISVANNNESESTDSTVLNKETLSPQETKKEGIKDKNTVKNRTITNEVKKDNSDNNNILTDDILTTDTPDIINPDTQVAMTMERSLDQIPAYDGEENSEQVSIDDTLSDEAKEYDWGIEFGCENVRPDGMTIVISQHDGNATGELMTGEFYEILMYDDEIWEEAPKKIQDDQVVWNSLGYLIKKDDNTKLDVNWGNLYGELLPGKYKIGKNITDLREPGDYDKCMYYAEFEIE